jgi:transglutaminase superfamily protein
MSMRVALGTPVSLGARERLLGMASVVRARRLVRHHTPEEIGVRLDEVLGRRSRAATAEEARRADLVVCAVRLDYLGNHDPTERAVATALLLAMTGCRVRWCWGVRTPPVETTAWVEAGGCAIGAAFNVAAAFTPLVTTSEAPR